MRTGCSLGCAPISHDDKPEVPSHNTFNVDISVGRKRTHALFEKSDPGAVAVFRMRMGGGE